MYVILKILIFVAHAYSNKLLDPVYRPYCYTGVIIIFNFLFMYVILKIHSTFNSIQFNSILEWMDDDCFDREYNLERLIHSFWLDWFLLKQWNEVPHAHYFICADYSTVLSTRVNKYIITNTINSNNRVTRDSWLNSL